ncbi:filamentous hemagglutinin N-terminal domain-containing protein, partial [Pseudomonas sp. ZM23]
MDIRHPLYQAIASALAGILFLNPIVATAAELAVDAAAGGNTAIGAAGNGVPVVNIAAPNGAGLSHNRFSDYNVGQNGLILNNATGKTQSTQLGGIIVGNPNLKGVAAQKILNEVTGANPSQLRGYTEVAGQAAHVIVANPHGITCNGCGFINTPRATLTTGKPLMDGERLRGYDVDGGEIAIEGAGLNASNIDQFELITRSAKLNANLYANQLTVVTGRNQVDADSLAATAKADDGSAKPQLAIDSSALGGMYAGAIRLVGTEQGVGVKLAGNMAASAGDIQIDASGKLSLAQTSAAGSVRINAESASLQGPAYAANTADVQVRDVLDNAQSLAAGTHLTIHAGSVENTGTLESGVSADGTRNGQGDLELRADSLRNSGALIAGRNADIALQGTADNRSGVISAQALNIHADQLDNRGGSLLGASSVQLSAQTLDNRERGLVQSRGVMALNLGQTLQNGTGQLASLGRLDLNVEQLLNQGGEIYFAQGGALHSADIDNRLGVITSAAPLDIRSGRSIQNQGGRLVSDGALHIAANSLNNREEGLISAGGDLALDLTTLNNNGGSVHSGGDQTLQSARVENYGGHLLSLGKLSWNGFQMDTRGGDIRSQGDIQFDGTSLLNTNGNIASAGNLLGSLLELQQHEGYIVANGNVGLAANIVENSQDSLIAGGQSLDLQSFYITNAEGGELASHGTLGLRTDLLDNRAGGRIDSAADFTLRAERVLNQGGTLSSGGYLALFARLLDNRDSGLVASSAGMSLQLSERLLNQGGRLSTGADLLLAAPFVDNSANGQIGVGGFLTLQANTFNNAGGLLEASGLGLSGDHLDNHGGNLVGRGDMRLSFSSIDNRGGRLGSEDDLTLDAQSIDNTEQGEILATRDLSVTADTLDNRGGRLYAGRIGDLRLARLDNRQGTIEGRGDLRIAATDLDNRQGAITSEQSLQLTAADLLNSLGLFSANQSLIVRGNTLENADGQVLGGNAVTLNLQQLDNRQGDIQAGGTLDIDTDTLLNSDGHVATGQLQLAARQIDNRNGELAAQRNARVTVTELLDQGDGGRLLSESNLQVVANDIINRDGGEIAAGSSLALTAQNLDNQSGRLSSQGQANLEIGRMDNRAGTLSAQRLTASLGELDNSDGILSATATASIDVGRLNNRGGQLNANELSVTASQLNNQDGRLLGQDALALFVSELLNHAGVISSQGRLALQGDTLDNGQGLIRADGNLLLESHQVQNSAGQISSRGNLVVAAQRLDNSAGDLLANGSLQVTADTLLNDAGRLSAQGAVDLRVGEISNRQGEVSSAASLNLEANDLDNTDGTLQAGGNLQARMTRHLENLRGLILGQGTQVQSDTLTNQDGTIASGTSLRLDVRELDNGAGQLIANGDLGIGASALENSQGRIYSGGDTRLDVIGLHQQGGEIVSQGSLDIVGERLENLGGAISSQGDSQLQTTELTNQSGRISSAGALAIQTGTLDNQEGQIGAQEAVSVEADTVDNRAGAITGNASLTLLAQLIDNRDEGQISAQGDILISGGELDNRGGVVSGAQSVELNLDRLRNAGGRISATDQLKLSVGDLQQDGGILNGGSLWLDLRGSDFDNSGGILDTSGSLSIFNTRQLLNYDGEIHTGGDLILAAEAIHNEGGLLASGGKLLIQLPSGDVYNDRGRMVAANTLGITGYRLSNQQGQLIGDADIRLSPEDIQNGDGGLIQSAANLYIDAIDLDNRGGQMFAQNTLNLTVRDGVLNSDGGRIGSGDLLRVRATDLDNHAGELNAQGDLRVYVEHLIQRQGLLLSGGNLEYDAKGQDLDNSGGAISANGHLLLSNLRDLGNQGGTLASQEDIALDLRDLDNSGGQISSDKNIALTLRNITNQGGVLDSVTGMVELHATEHLDNQANGLIQGNDLLLDIAAGVDNRHGTISAVTGDLTLSTPLIDNTAGGLYAYQTLLLQGENLINTGTSLATGGRIGAGAVDLRLSGTLDNHNGLIEGADGFGIQTASLNNQGGYLRDLGEDGATRFNVSGQLDNRGGTIESANHDIRFDIGSLLNQDGRILHAGNGVFGLASDSVFHAGGLLGTNGLMTLQANSWVNDTILRAGRLDLNIGEFSQTANGKLLAADGLVMRGNNWHNDGVIATDGDLSLSLTGSYSGGGLLSSLGNLDLNAANVTLSSAGRIRGAADAQIVTGNLDNAGRVTSAGDLRITAERITNSGTLGSADALQLTSQTLTNSGLIFSGADMALRVDSLYNDGGDLYSLAGLTLAGRSGGRAQSLENSSGHISSVGNMALDVASFSNHRDASAQNAMIDAGGNFTATGSTFTNLNGSIFAAGNLGIATGVFRNDGSAQAPAVIHAGAAASVNASQKLGNGDVLDNTASANPIRNLADTHANSEISPITISGSAGTGRIVPNLNLPDGGLFHLADSGVPQGGANPPAGPGAYQPDTRQHPGIPAASANNWQVADGVAGDALASLGVRIALDGSRVRVEPPKGLNADGSVKRPGSDVLGVTITPGTNVPGVDYSGADISRFIPIAAGATGLPGSDWSTPVHKYLVYTDPDLASLIPGSGIGSSSGNGTSTSTSTSTSGTRGVVSSDYLLARLGFDPDRAQKRLGDGLYEQFLLSQALIEKTGLRYLNGLTNDADVFRYLMDNAVAYRDSLQLTLGVALSAEQVAALTHDIVWLEERVVNGEKVLVPVLYLASADGHLTDKGALIQGRDVKLISGGELANHGILKASENLGIAAGKLDNTGQVLASRNLDVRVVDNIHNHSGGLIKGGEVSLTALNGDIVNERDHSTRSVTSKGSTRSDDSVGSASRIESTGNLSLSAGRDIISTGSAIVAGGSASFDAGRDLLIRSQDAAHQLSSNHGNKRSSSLTQYKGEVSVGGDLAMHAGHDASVVGTPVKAGGDIVLDAGRDVTLASASNETHSYNRDPSGSKKSTRQSDHVQQQAGTLSAGGKVVVSAGHDITLVASKISAGGTAYLVAGNQINLLAANDSDYSLYDMKKKGSWGKKKTQHDETTVVNAIGSGIEAGGGI